jgi:hypothetical protein
LQQLVPHPAPEIVALLLGPTLRRDDRGLGGLDVEVDLRDHFLQSVLR